jgi:transposase
VKLAEVLKYNLQSVRSYLHKGEFQRFWEYRRPQWAGRFLDEWCTRVLRSRIEPMKKVARMLRSHRELLLNWFRAKGTISAGIVEGLNNKVKLTMRKSYGFRTSEAVEIALYHNLAKLPEPEFTHRFWCRAIAPSWVKWHDWRMHRPPLVEEQQGLRNMLCRKGPGCPQPTPSPCRNTSPI